MIRAITRNRRRARRDPRPLDEHTKILEPRESAVGDEAVTQPCRQRTRDQSACVDRAVDVSARGFAIAPALGKTRTDELDPQVELEERKPDDRRCRLADAELCCWCVSERNLRLGAQERCEHREETVRRGIDLLHHREPIAHGDRPRVSQRQREKSGAGQSRARRDAEPSELPIAGTEEALGLLHPSAHRFAGRERDPIPVLHDESRVGRDRSEGTSHRFGAFGAVEKGLDQEEAGQGHSPKMRRGLTTRRHGSKPAVRVSVASGGEIALRQVDLSVEERLRIAESLSERERTLELARRGCELPEQLMRETARHDDGELEPFAGTSGYELRRFSSARARLGHGAGLRRDRREIRRDEAHLLTLPGTQRNALRAPETAARAREIVRLVVGDSQVVEDERSDGRRAPPRRQARSCLELLAGIDQIHASQLEVPHAGTQQHLGAASEALARARVRPEKLEASSAGGLRLIVRAAKRMQLSEFGLDDDDLLAVALGIGAPADIGEQSERVLDPFRAVVVYAETTSHT